MIQVLVGLKLIYRAAIVTLVEETSVLIVDVLLITRYRGTYTSSPRFQNCPLVGLDIIPSRSTVYTSYHQICYALSSIYCRLFSRFSISNLPLEGLSEKKFRLAI